MNEGLREAAGGQVPNFLERITRSRLLFLGCCLTLAAPPSKATAPLSYGWHHTKRQSHLGRVGEEGVFGGGPTVDRPRSSSVKLDKAACMTKHHQALGDHSTITQGSNTGYTELGITMLCGCNHHNQWGESEIKFPEHRPRNE